MGQMKRFGMRLANMIYEKRMSDEAIISALKQSNPASTSSPDNKWLKEQIKSVRNNPSAWRPQANREI